MLQLDFPGSDEFIRSIDAAVQAGDECAVTDALRNTLCRMIREQRVQMPACVYQPCGEHYARRELYHSDALGYDVIAMTWGPGQGTLLHDHSGLWCVEGVWHGALEITQYDLLEAQEARFRFQPVGSIQAGKGSAGSLIPPHEYHTIRNPADDGVAVSVHIYAAQMKCCAIFRPVGDRWYERDLKQLALD